MAGLDDLKKGSNENIVDKKELTLKSVTGSKKSDISENFQDIHRMKFHAEKIELDPGTTFHKAVEMLLQQKAEGKNCFINFNGTKIYSADTNDVDDAYIQYKGMTKAEVDERSRKQHEEREASEREREKREKGYVKKIEDSRKGAESVTITKDVIINGLKFIAEHSDMEQNQLIDELIALGCNFTFKDIKEQFPDAGKLFPGMERGELASGASVIANYMCSEYGRSYVDDRFLSLDDSTSIYACIRKLTGDATYTKEYVNSLKEKEK